MILNRQRRGAQAVYRLRPTATTDSYGDPVISWTNPSRLPLFGASVGPSASTETESPTADTVRAERVLIAPGAVDITATDRVEVDGQVWRIDGVPDVRSGFVLGVHTTASLRRVAG